MSLKLVFSNLTEIETEELKTIMIPLQMCMNY